MAMSDSQRRMYDARKKHAQQEQQSYRQAALKLFPHICAACGREFSGKRLKELTVHHKDNNHKNNPPDGSNWELLCLYCHDYEHQRHEIANGDVGTEMPEQVTELPSIFSPFEGLDSLLGSEDKKEKE